MLFTFDWLKRYLSTDLSINQISDKLTSVGLEVESIKDPEVIFRNFQIVQIEKAISHPDADKLKICTVFGADGEKRQIVCGAKNVRVGLRTILAKPDAVVPASGMVIKKMKLRGVESNGMLCSKGELGIQSNDEGIIELDNDINMLTPVGDILGYGGGIFDISITPNRGDCFSVKGIARDLAVAGAGKFIPPKDVYCKSSFNFPIKINYERNDACKRYAPVIAFRVIRGVKNGESPEWLKIRLKTAGINTISAIVDLGNLWLIETGRPLHIYDLKKIEGDVSIRFARKNEKFVDIKGNSHVLHQDMLIASDDKDPLCLLGIMGSSKTACDENTTDILIESGLFDPIFISRTGSFLNITSDSRTRFERCIDRDSCVPGLEFATKSILDTCGGAASNIFVVGEHLNIDRTVSLTKNKLRSVTGSNIDWIKSKKVLHSLGLKEVRSTDDCSVFLIPSWRSDLNIEEDLIEEIIRIVGYENVQQETIYIPIKTVDHFLEKKRNIFSIKRLLASRGLSEIISYSFVKLDYVEEFRCNKKLLHLLNPISEDLAVMRPSLLPSLIMASKRSLHYGKNHVALFEVGNVFYGNCDQVCHISGLRVGAIANRSWLEKTRIVDVFDVKADMFSVLDYMGIRAENLTIKNEAPLYYHPSRSATVYQGKKNIGYFGELHPKINKLFSVNDPIVCFEIVFEDLPKIKKSFQFNSKVFPKINRDFSFVFDAKVPVGNMVSQIYKLDSKILHVDIFDCFSISNLKKSVGINVLIGSNIRTLTEEEAVEVSNKVIEYVNSCGGELRKK